MGSLHSPGEIEDGNRPLSGSDRVGPYRLQRALGAGGMSDVYRAVDERCGRPVAIKYLQPPFARERFRLEAKVIASLDHPAIVRVFDVIENEAGGWMVMELVEGRLLSSLIAEAPLDTASALPIFQDLAEAIAEAHAKGVLHRDLKTDNVMITPSGRAKLLDFGLARWIEPRDHQLTLDGQIVGTPHAMSPEQAMSLDLDHRSDLFSLGTLFYEVVTGERPFHGVGIVDTIRKVCVERHRAARELNARIPRELSGLIDRMLAKDPEHRPRSAGEVARRLRRLARRGRDETARRAPRIAPVEAPRPEPEPAPGREWRTITVVHCELTSSGRPPEALDPEELLALRPELQRLAARAAERFEGEVGEHLRQGLRLFFGLPKPQVDDARRAVYAAREIVAGFEGLVADAGEGLLATAGENLGVRVGIHTGRVAVAVDPVPAAGTPPILGATGRLAAALKEAASPGELLLSAATHKVVDRFFSSEARPPLRVRGFSKPIERYRWLDERSKCNALK